MIKCMLFKEFFNETCDLDFLMEIATLAQTLKQHKDLELVKLVKMQVREHLTQIPFFSQPMGKKMFDRHVNYFVYQIMKDQTWQFEMQKALTDPTHQKDSRWEIPATELKQQVVTNAVKGRINQMWRSVGDYFVAMGDRVASKLNNPSYGLEEAGKESREWHEELAARARGLPNQEAKTFLKLDHLGKQWKGWKWVDLEKGYCSEEGKAMGHCGNVADNDGDNIVSLRDANGYAHLTFIINDGFLGEAKGRGNDKPVKRYHAPIVELLKSKYVESIKGGGHEPQNNFHFDDLHDDHKKELEHKPHMNDPFNHLLEKYKGDPKKMVGGINEFFNSTSFEDFDGNNFTLETFKGHDRRGQKNDGSFMMKWVGPFEEIEEVSKGWEKEVRVGWLDDMEPQDDSYHGMDDAELISTLNTENLDKIKKIISASRDDLDGGIDEYDLEELIAEDEEIMEALKWAAGDAQSSANQSEAWESVRKQLSGEDEHGFWIDFNSDPWALKISLESIKGLYSTMQQDQALDYGDIESYISIDYSEPQGGHYGSLDNAHYNELVSDRLHDIPI